MRIYLFVLAALFFLCGTLTGQVPDFPPVETLTPETLFRNTVEPLYGLLVLLSGYVSGFIPGVNKYRPFLRVAAFALALALGFHLFGGASIWQLALTYFFTSGLYDIFIKNILASPKAANVHTA
jgi:hypothetical protein